MRAHAIPLTIIVLLLSLPLAAAQRVTLLLPAVEGPALRCGIVFTGADFYRWTGCPRPAISALRLSGPAGPLPLQVEERDGTGRVLAQGNGRLDDDDRVAFLVELTRTPRKIVLDYQATATAPTDPPTTVQAIAQPGKSIPLLLQSGELTIGIGGGGNPDPKINQRANFGRGCITYLAWQGATVLNTDVALNNALPRAFASGPGAPAWSTPAVVISGPVRTIVEIHCQGYQLSRSNNDTLNADVTRYITLWNGLPVIDIEEIVNYTASGLEQEWPYALALPIGKTLDEHDRLIVPLADQAYVVPVAPDPQQLRDQPWRQVYATDNPDEGWFAWQDTVEKTGLATFYEPLAPMRARAAWVTYRPALQPVVTMRTTPGNLLETNLRFKDRALRCRSSYHREIRLIALRDETPQDIRTLYHLWGQPIGENGNRVQVLY